MITINIDTLDLPVGDWIPVPAVVHGGNWWLAGIHRHGLPPAICGDPLAGIALMRGKKYRCTFYRYSRLSGRSNNAELRTIDGKKYLIFTV